MSYFYSILAQINNSTPYTPTVWDTYSCPVGTWKSIACNGTNKFVAIANGSTSEYTKVMYSTDAMTWTLLSTELPFRSVNIAFNNGKFAIYGYQYNFDLYRSDRVLFISDDGITWTTKVLDFDANYSKICSANGRFFVLPFNGFGYFYTSTNGITWTSNYIQSTVSSNMYPVDITYFNGKYLLLSENGLCAYCTNDFNFWTRFNLSQSVPWTVIENINSNKVFALSSSIQTAQSLDGDTWTHQSQTNANFTFGEFGMLASGYFVGGNQDKIVYSINGLTTFISKPKDSRLLYLTAVCHSNDKFVVVGQGNSGATEQVVQVFKIG